LIGIASDTRHTIARHNLRLVVSVAKKTYIPGISFYELISNGNVTLLKTIDKFDVGRINEYGTSNKFCTYATWALINNFNNNRRPTKKEQGPPLIDVDPYDVPIAVAASEETPNEPAFDVELLRQKLDDRRVITEREADILRLRYFDEMSWEEVGKKYDICKERVRVVVEAQKKLRVAMEAEYVQLPSRVAALFMS
jgi:RNA polymerase primary sigma factor